MPGRNAELEITYEDDPRVVQEQRTEDYAAHAVPVTARVGRFKLLMSSWSLLSAMVWLFYGALVAGMVGTGQALIGLVATVLVYSVLGWVLTGWGTRWGLNSTLLSRRMFGAYGAVLTALLLAATTLYYAVFESSVLAQAFRIRFGGPGLHWWYLIVVVALLPLMLGSVQTWMDRLNAYLLPLYVVGMVAAVVVAAVKYGNGSQWFHFAGSIPAAARPAPGWLMAFALYMGIWINMPITVEFSRLGRPQDLRFHQHVTFGWVFYIWLFLLNGLAGIYLTSTVLPAGSAGETGVVQALVKVLGVWGVLLIVVTQVRINTLNYYVSSTNWGRLAQRLAGLRLPRIAWVVAVAVVAFLLMLTDVFSYLQSAMNWQGVFLVSWVGIVVTHFVTRPAERRSGPEFRPGRLKAVTPGLAVWIAASGIGIWLTRSSRSLPTLSSLAPLVALGVSVVLYALVLAFGPSSLVERGADPRDEVADPQAARIACTVCSRSYTAVEMDRDPARDGAAVCTGCAETDRVFLRAARSQGPGAGAAETEPSAARV